MNRTIVSELTNIDKEQIVEAVERVERRSDGEVVVFVAPDSGRYRVAFWRACVLFFFAFVASIVLLRYLANDWTPVWLGGDYFVIGVGTIGSLITANTVMVFPRARRVFISARELRNNVDGEANRTFISENIFATKNRSGILIFVSEYEHMFHILPDVGVASHVEDNRWNAVVDRMESKLRETNLVSAIIEGVDACGDILESTVPLVDPNVNELEDHVRDTDGGRE